MKKFMVLVLMLFSITIFAQSTGAYKGGGIVFADSLTNWADTTGYYSGTGWLHPSDSAYVVNLGLFWGFPVITVKDTSAATGALTDSIKCYAGSVRYADGINHTITDTLWTTQALPFKTNAWTVDTTMVGSGKISRYTLLDNSLQLLKIVRVNHTSYGTGLGIRTDIVIEVKKD